MQRLFFVFPVRRMHLNDALIILTGRSCSETILKFTNQFHITETVLLFDRDIKHVFLHFIEFQTPPFT